MNACAANSKELQTYTNRTENIQVTDGNLVMTARYEDYDGRMRYTSARIDSRAKGVWAPNIPYNGTFYDVIRIEGYMKVPSGRLTCLIALG